MATYTQASDITGLVTATLDKFRRNDFADLTSDVQEYVALRTLMQKHRSVWEGGEQYTFTAQTGTSGSARATGLFDTDVVQPRDDLTTGRIPMRHFTVNTAFDRLEGKFNAGPARIVDHIKARKRAAMVDMHKFMEAEFWGKPSTSSDEESLWGVDQPITYPTTFSAEGFCGGNPSGFTSGYAGISSSTYPRWANYYDQYAALTYEDFGVTVKKAMRRCRFMPPVPYPGGPVRGDLGLYSGMDVLNEMEARVREQNDNWKNDVLAASTGETLFRRVPLNWVPFLDSALSNDTDSRSDLAAYDPIYGINWATMKIVYFKGEWLAMTVRPSAEKHTVTEVHWDLSCNLACEDRRPNFLVTLNTLC